MYIQNSHISKLIVLHLKNELNADQKEELNLWLKEDCNQKIFGKITSKSAILNKVNEYDTDQMNEVWVKLDKQLFKKPDYLKWLSYAAVIILPLAIGFFILNQTPKFETEIAQFEELKPGETNAKLYFANGDVVDLKEDNFSTLRSDDNLLVKNSDEKLQINSDELLASSIVKMNRIVTPIGGEYQVELPDGTKVWLNADSYLEFPSKFADKQRKVIAKGEAYFDVVSNKDWPFIVESQGVELKVLGTEFNLRAYVDEDYITTSLIEGSVLVSNSFNNKVKLSPGKQVSVGIHDNKMTESEADIEAVTAWRNGRFIFKKKRVENIMYDLARWYNVKIFFSNSSVKDVTITLDAPRYGKIEDILSLIEGTRDVNFDIKGRIINVN